MGGIEFAKFSRRLKTLPSSSGRQRPTLVLGCSAQIMSKIKIVLLFVWILLSVLFAMKFGAIPDLVGLDKVEVPFIVIPWAMILGFGIYRLKKKITSTTRA